MCIRDRRLVSTKPLSRSGQVIDHFTVDFKDGRVVDCHAEQGEEVLKKMFAMDEGASMLGEVALVDVYKRQVLTVWDWDLRSSRKRWL